MSTSNPHRIRNYRDLKMAQQKIKGQREATKTIISESWRATRQMAGHSLGFPKTVVGKIISGLRIGKSLLSSPSETASSSANGQSDVPNWMDYVRFGLDLVSSAESLRHRVTKQSEE